MKIEDRFWKMAADITGGDRTITTEDAVDILFRQVETLGWATQDDPDLVTDPAGKSHYMHCYDLVAQAYEIIMLDADLRRLGML